jgi:hypothetical protein
MTPYVVKTMIDYLADREADVRVSTTVPADRPSRLVTITTAPANAHPKPEDLSWRRLIIQCHNSGGELGTAELCERVRTHVLASRYASIGIRAVSIIGEPANFPDPDDSTPRFQLTADVLMRVT